MLYDDDEEEVVDLRRGALRDCTGEAETEQSSEKNEDLSDDEYTDKIKQEISIKYGKGAAWSELFFDPSYERVRASWRKGVRERRS